MTHKNSNEKVLLHGIEKPITTFQFLWLFIFGSVFGTWYEEIITFIKIGQWENRSSVIIGPFNPLYGVAYIISVALFYRKRKPVVTILLASLFGGAFEYAANWAQEFFTGSVSWNYHNLFLNINGRTTVVYALFWGVLIYLAVQFVTPFFIQLLERINTKSGRIFTTFFMIFLCLNMVITYSMLIRQGLRVKGIEPYTPIGEFYDKVFTDEYIQKKFPNMVLIKKEG